jgi:hypothetical protein
VISKTTIVAFFMEHPVESVDKGIPQQNKFGWNLQHYLQDSLHDKQHNDPSQSDS